MGVMLSVVIPVRDGARTLPAQLEALLGAERPAADFEVVVADNGSTDDTWAIALSYADRLPLHVVDASGPAGINVARNRGIQAAAGDRLLLCDADDEVDSGWLTAMEAAFDAGHQLVAGPLDYRRLNDARTRASRGADQVSVMVVLDFLPTGHGANMGFTRAIYDKVGGFDEAFVGGGDDIDFCWRAQLAGASLHEAPTAVVHYRLRTDVRGVAGQARAYGMAEALLYRKYRRLGLGRRPASLVFDDLWWLASRAPAAIAPARRAAWVRRANAQAGRLLGARRHGTWWV